MYRNADLQIGAHICRKVEELMSKNQIDGFGQENVRFIQCPLSTVYYVLIYYLGIDLFPFAVIAVLLFLYYTAKLCLHQIDISMCFFTLPCEDC